MMLLQQLITTTLAFKPNQTETYKYYLDLSQKQNLKTIQINRFLHTGGSWHWLAFMYVQQSDLNHGLVELCSQLIEGYVQMLKRELRVRGSAQSGYLQRLWNFSDRFCINLLFIACICLFWMRNIGITYQK